ncbi:ATP-binding protein, partial [bacterium]|nr:ATP-binding protein [candidate division CSSED10-310 bacterium]
MPRNLENIVIEYMKHFPIVAILGSRQCGKSTLAIHLRDEIENMIYLDLQRNSDVQKIHDPELFFQMNPDRVVCLDEIQRVPELFLDLRSIVDQKRQNGQLIILGSASRDLIMQSSESLAGRIAYLELSPFLLSEVNGLTDDNLQRFWLRGGYPDSFLAVDDFFSLEWRRNFVRTYLERDIPQLGFNISASRMERLWRMLAHNHSQILNSSKLGQSLDVSHHTIRRYVDLLEQTYMVRVLNSYTPNLKKRLIKSPKVYLRDSGVLHSLLGIESINDLLGHPNFGASWEGMVIENILSELSHWKGSFYRTAAGAEVDLLIEKGNRRIAVEIKASKAPSPTKGFWQALDDLA